MIYQLPTYHNTFIGRRYHLQAIISLLRSENNRLITLLGPGGIGKTRLSVRIGELMADDFVDGVCFVPLDVLTDPEQVPLYIGHRLGLNAGNTTSWIHRIIHFLSGKDLLLILDNLEQVLESAGSIAQLLDACPSLKILVTSRAILGLSQEVEYPLDSLNRPNARLFPSPDDLLRFEAIHLFVQKAQTSQPSFQLNTDNAPAVVEICQELEGLPLPIELAAARIKLFSPKLILRQLKQSTGLLKTSARSVIHRHQNIRNTIQWSYDLLDEEEKLLFLQLSLFRGGFTPLALEAVHPEGDALEIIESFLNKSLIVKDKEIGDQPRFRMLKLIRDFGLDQLNKHPERDLYYRRFSLYFLHLLEALDKQYRTTAPTTWIELIEAEYENLGVVLDWSTGQQPEWAGKLGAGFWRYHLCRSFLREGMEMINRLLALEVKNMAVRARLLEAAGTLSHNLGNYPDAKGYLSRCMELWKVIEDKAEIVKTLNNLAWVEWRIGNYELTVKYSEKALGIGREIDDRQSQAKAMNNLAWVYFFRGQYNNARDLQYKVREIYAAQKNPRGSAFADTNLGWALTYSGNFHEARHLIRRGIDVFKKLKDQQLMAFSQYVMANWLLETGERDSARRLLSEVCLPDFSRIGDTWAIANTQCLLGKIYFLEKTPGTARDCLIQAREIFQHSHDKVGQARVDLWLSKLERVQKKPGRAAAYLLQCLKLAHEVSAYGLLKSAYQEYGLQECQQKQFSRALIYFAAAHHFANKSGNYQLQQFRHEVRLHLEAIPGTCRNADRVLTALKSTPQSRTYLPGQELNWQQLIRQLLDLTDRASSPPTLSGGIQEEQQQEIKESSQEDPFIQRAHFIVREHLCDTNFSVQELATALSVSPSQLHRKIKAHSGLSSGRFIRRIRLQQACSLLKDPALTITAVAYETGFRDADYFFRVFKKMYGITPGEYRTINA